MEQGVDADFEDQDELTALMLAAENNQIESVRLLLDAGADTECDVRCMIFPLRIFILCGGFRIGLHFIFGIVCSRESGSQNSRRKNTSGTAI